jgi:hypothetical protein
MPKEKIIKKRRNLSISSHTYLGHGSYGCVYDSVIPIDKKCVDAAKNRSGLQIPRFISKLMLEPEAINETSSIENIAVKLKKIPNYSNFFIFTDSTCSIDSGSALAKQLKSISIYDLGQSSFSDNENGNPKDCMKSIVNHDYYKFKREHAKQKHKKSYHIPPVVANISLHGGKDMLHWYREEFNDINSVGKLVFGIGNLLKGIEHLCKLNVVHNDIGLENIVGDDTYFRLIDFGLSFDIDTLWDQDIDSLRNSIGRFSKSRLMPELIGISKNNHVTSIGSFDQSHVKKILDKKMMKIFTDVHSFSSPENLHSAADILFVEDETHPLISVIRHVQRKFKDVTTVSFGDSGWIHKEMKAVFNIFLHARTNLSSRAVFINKYLYCIDTYWLSIETLRFLCGPRLALFLLWTEYAISSFEKRKIFLVAFFDCLLQMVQPDISRRLNGLHAWNHFNDSILKPYGIFLRKKF